MHSCRCDNYKGRLTVLTLVYFHTFTNMCLIICECYSQIIFSSSVSPPRSVSSVPIAKRGTLRISWTPPARLYSLQVTGYVIQYKETTSSQYRFSRNTPSSSRYELTGLSVGRSYHVRIAVRTTSGVGNYSTPVEGRTFNGE